MMYVTKVSPVNAPEFLDDFCTIQPLTEEINVVFFGVLRRTESSTRIFPLALPQCFIISIFSRPRKRIIALISNML